MKFAIHGSCVTRDMFEYNGRSRDLMHYQAQCSIATKGTLPVTETESMFSKLGENFIGRMICLDLQKTPPRLDDVDCLIIDLIDERFHVIRTGHSLVTDTLRLRESGICDQLEFEVPFPFDSDQHREQFRAGCRSFKDSLKTYSGVLVFHDARWATHYEQNAGIARFDESEKIAKANQRLEALASIICDILDFDVKIEPDERLLVAEEHHKWGRAPFHYVDAYYQDIWRKMNSELHQIMHQHSARRA